MTDIDQSFDRQIHAARVSGSLRRRLAITLITGVAVLTAIFYLVVRDYANQIAQQSQDSILKASVTSILDSAIIRNGLVELDIPYASFSMLTTTSDDRIFYAIYQDGTLLSGYDNMTQPELNDDSAELFQSTQYLNTAVRQVSASRTLVGAGMRTRIMVSIAQTQDSLSGILNRISQNAAVFGAGFFLVAVLLSLFATTQTIRPLKRLADSIARRGPQDLSPVVQRVPSEMVPLVSAFNHLMARLERSFSQSEEFIAEAAHRVRTPLSTVRSYAETTLQRVDKEENRQAVRSMIRAIDESSRAATQLLDHAMITFRANQLEYHDIDLPEIVGVIVQRLNPLAEMKDIDLQLDCDKAVRASGDIILIQNAIRNIIDNALKYSPSETTIEIKVRSLPGPLIEVCDHGPGFPDGELERVTQRFARGSNASGTIGSGLGLTIAQDVAVAHGGKLVLSNSRLGGACVSFYL